MSQKIKAFLFGSGFLSTIISVVLICLLRFFGVLEPYELNLLDRLFLASAGDNLLSDKIILVTIAEKDINRLNQYPLSDRQLVQILQRIKQTRPRVIGLDIIRNFAVYDRDLSLAQNQLAYQQLQAIFRETNNLYGIAKITEASGFSSIPGAQILAKAERLTAADLVLDKDGVARKGNLYPDYQQNIPGLGLATALKYLEPEGIYPQFATRQKSQVCLLPKDYPQSAWLQLGSQVLCPLTPNWGGYATHSDSGYQILIDWRSRPRFLQINISDILTDNFNPSLFQDRLVLIGNTSLSAKDLFFTPLSKNTENTPDQMSGVEIIAHLANQIINVAQEKIFPLTAWTERDEIVWITLWAFCLQLTFLGFFRVPSRYFWLLGTTALVFFALSLYYLDLYFFLSRGIWLPLLPGWLCFLLQSFFTIFIFFYLQLIRTNNTLEIKVRERTRSLQQALEDLRQMQQAAIAQEKLNFLGKNTVYISHEIRNPLGCIELANLLSLDSLNQLTSRDDYAQSILDNCYQIERQIERINRIIVQLNERIRSDDIPPLDTNLEPIIDEALEITVYSFGIRHHWTEPIQITKDYAPNLPPIQLYSTDFERALSNLIDNSLYSLKQKKTKNSDFFPRLSLTTKQLEGQVQIIIEDNGEGIAPEDEDKIFEEFYSTKEDEGTGLGLFIVKQIIEGKHGGKISLLSERGQFTRVTIALKTEL